MSKNSYSGVDSYAAFFVAYKAKTLTRMPMFSADDFEDLQQELMIAYLHAWPSFDPSKGDRRSDPPPINESRNSYGNAIHNGLFKGGAGYGTQAFYGGADYRQAA